MKVLEIEKPLTTEQNDLHRVDVSFTNIKYAVQQKKKGLKNILNGVTGVCKSGDVNAIMGASGAGKTTLLNLLSCRIAARKSNKLEGELLANGQPYEANMFSRFAAYVMQNDVLLDTLTPKECLMFAANMRLSGTPEFRKRRVDEVIKELRLEKCQNTMVGGHLRKGISGGERKRASIGVELITNPSVIMLDEPTSGLDSFTAFLIISLLRRYAKTGKNVIFTIHQPDADVFNLFDRLILLVEGKLIYQGACSKARLHFDGLGYKCPTYSNPPDYFMEIMHPEFQANNMRERFDGFFKAYDSHLAPIVNNELNEVHKGKVELVVPVNHLLYEISQIAKRSAINVRRNPMLMRGRFAQTIILALICGWIYWGLPGGPVNPRAVTNRNGALFFICLNQFMMSMQAVTLTFPSERALFLKEENSKMYGVVAYYFGKTGAEIPVLVIFPTIFSLIVYWMIGFNNTSHDRFAIFWFVCILQSLAGNALGLMVGSMFSDAKVAAGFLPMIFVPMMLFSGFYTNRDNLPVWIGWFEFVSPFKYCLEAFITNEYTDVIFFPDPIKLLSFSFGMWESIWTLLGLGLGYRVLALIFLKIKGNYSTLYEILSSIHVSFWENWLSAFFVEFKNRRRKFA